MLDLVERKNKAAIYYPSGVAVSLCKTFINKPVASEVSGNFTWLTDTHLSTLSCFQHYKYVDIGKYKKNVT